MIAIERPGSKGAGLPARLLRPAHSGLAAGTERCFMHVERAASRALYEELELYPKPGLVSFVDHGSHADMTACTFLRSIISLRDYFGQIAEAGTRAASFRELQSLAIRAEQRMLLATSAVNTHRGAIFMLGMLCAAAGRCRHVGVGSVRAGQLRATLIETWGQSLEEHARRTSASHGQRACRQHGLRGARREGAEGFPVLFDHAVPTLRAAHQDGLDRRHALLQTFFVVMARLEDTNLVHRAGMKGLWFAQREAQNFLSAGGAYRSDAVAHAESIHRTFVRRGLSPGGAADTLAAACWVVQTCT